MKQNSFFLSVMENAFQCDSWMREEKKLFSMLSSDGFNELPLVIPNMKWMLYICLFEVDFELNFSVHLWASKDNRIKIGARWK